MIENLRKYTGLIIIVVVLVFVGMVFFFDSGFLTQRGGGGGGGTYITVDGRGYSRADFTNLAVGPLDMARSIPANYTDSKGMEVVQFTGALAQGAQTQEVALQRFFVGRLKLREARESFGVHPSDEDVAAFIQELGRFQSEGGFDQETYNRFAKREIGHLGLTEADFQELVRDVIAFSELREIIGGGLPGNRELAEALAVENAQKVSVVTASLPMESFKESIEPDDEALRTYWEERKDAYQTEKRIKVSYVLASPIYPEEFQEPEPEPAAEGEEKTDEEKVEEQTARENRAAERRKIDKALAGLVDGFLTELDIADGEGFEKLAEDLNWKVVGTDWFTRADAPADLKLSPRGSSAGNPVLAHLFELTLEGDPLARFSEGLAVGQNQWLVARLDDVEEPREKTFEEAREQVLEQYVAEKSREALEEAVEEHLAAIDEAMEGGKSFAEAAAERGLEVREHDSFAATDRLEDEPNARQIFSAAATTNPGGTADPLYLPDRAVLVHVLKREVFKDDNRGLQVDNQVGRLTDTNQYAAFSAWIEDQIASATVQAPQG